MNKAAAACLLAIGMGLGLASPTWADVRPPTVVPEILQALPAGTAGTAVSTVSTLPTLSTPKSQGLQHASDTAIAGTPLAAMEPAGLTDTVAGSTTSSAAASASTSTVAQPSLDPEIARRSPAQAASSGLPGLPGPQEAAARIAASFPSAPTASSQAALPVAKAPTVTTAAPQSWHQKAIERLAKAGGRTMEVARLFGKSVGEDTALIVVSAVDLIGLPYRWGGESIEEGFDCSGLIKHVYENSIGLVLPRTAAEQAKANSLMKVDKEALQPGDLVFFKTTRKAFSHVGLYVGDGQFVHAPRTGADIRIDSIRNNYWDKRFNGARRSKP